MIQLPRLYCIVDSAFLPTTEEVLGYVEAPPRPSGWPQPDASRFINASEGAGETPSGP